MNCEFSRRDIAMFITMCSVGFKAFNYGFQCTFLDDITEFQTEKMGTLT